MIGNIFMDTKDPVVIGADPKVAIVVKAQGEDAELTSIESARRERADGARASGRAPVGWAARWIG